MKVICNMDCDNCIYDDCINDSDYLTPEERALSQKLDTISHLQDKDHKQERLYNHSKTWRKNNPDYQRRYYRKNIEKFREYGKEYSKQHYAKHKQEYSDKHKAYYKEHCEELKAKQREYDKEYNNKPEVKARKLEWQRQKRKRLKEEKENAMFKMQQQQIACN